MLISRLPSRLRSLLSRIVGRANTLSLTWHRQNTDSWLGANFPNQSFVAPRLERMQEIESIALSINALGQQPLWEGYRSVYQRDTDIPWAKLALERMPDQVRSQPEIGCLFAWMAQTRRPGLIVEFGTAFGISAMYWAAGLDRAGTGRLLTFEPNEIWHSIAAKHLRKFSPRATAFLGTFEGNIDRHMDSSEKIGIGFVDAIHTSHFVTPQVELLIERLAPDGLIILDDICFSDDMRKCWEQWSDDPRVKASVAVNDRVGILEFGND